MDVCQMLKIYRPTETLNGKQSLSHFVLLTEKARQPALYMLSESRECTLEGVSRGYLFSNVCCSFDLRST